MDSVILTFDQPNGQIANTVYRAEYRAVGDSVWILALSNVQPNPQPNPPNIFGPTQGAPSNIGSYSSASGIYEFRIVATANGIDAATEVITLPLLL